MPDPRRPGTGRVADFDADRGLGTVAADDGRTLPFHCTAIADGSRMIDPGTRVSFVTFPGHLGRTEARGLVPV
ncbi:MAG TPA: cold-shock protein [Acidimicrobiales bacterium]|nr:cold-shock protein [Acidimicrobiales bacterium]